MNDKPVKAKPLTTTDRAIWDALKMKRMLRYPPTQTWYRGDTYFATLRTLRKFKTSRERHGHYATAGLDFDEVVSLLM